MSRHAKLLIIGSGPAGYTAAIYAARANLSPVVLTGMSPGGQLMITTDVENYPGFRETIQGPWLMGEMQAQAEHCGAEVLFETVERVDFSKKPFRVITDSHQEWTADAVIISTGAQARWLDLPSEETYRGYGVSACATCDGFFFKGKKVAVIGGGNTAVEEALYLTNFASEVVIIHRRDQLRAEKIAQNRLFKNPKVSVLWNHVVDEFLGEESPRSLTSLRLKNIINGSLQEWPFDGAFVAIGHNPNSHVFKEHISCDGEGYILVKPGTTQTSISGVFAAGDVQDKIFRQAVTAAGQGCMAALEAEKYLNH